MHTFTFIHTRDTQGFPYTKNQLNAAAAATSDICMYVCMFCIVVVYHFFFNYVQHNKGRHR